MAQHFWLRANSVSLSGVDIARLDEEQARAQLARLRWGDGAQACPACGVIDSHYDIRSRSQWRCKACNHTFSVTSGTPFADCKIGHVRLLLAIFSFVVNQKGIAALALKRLIGGQYRTSYTLLQKIREAVMLTVSASQLEGVIEVDGGHFAGKKRKGRKMKLVVEPAARTIPKKHLKAQHRDKIAPSEFPHHPNRRIVLVLREVYPPGTGKGKGAVRTRVAVIRSENTADVEALVKKYVAKQSTVRSDELPAYGNLKLLGYFHETVNHSVEFSTDGGVNQNQAESFFSRMRRAFIGVYHKITPRYMVDYAHEMAWREDARRTDTLGQMRDLMKRVCSSGRSTDWINYGRKGHKRPVELLFDARAQAA
jgi:transposase-like protein